MGLHYQQARDETIQAERWMHQRLADCNIGPLVTGDVVIYSTHKIEPPAQFRDFWHWVDEPHRTGQLSELEYAQLAGAEACILFSDILSDDHMKLVHDLIESITLHPEAPPVILLSHSAPEISAQRPDDPEAAFNAWARAMTIGIDDIILEDLSGLRLCLEIQSRIMHQTRTTVVANEKVNEQRAASEYARDIEDTVYDIVWQYLSVRLHTRLPEIHPDIPPGHPQTIQGLTVAEKIGAGHFGTVNKLMDTDHNTTQVVRMLDKMGFTHAHGILIIKRLINVMESLSAEGHAHPNVMKFYQVYNTETHVLLRMEYCGPSDLNKLLITRESSKQVQVGLDKTASILSQCMAALSHIHSKPHIAHRNLKLDSFLVSETDGQINVKLADFCVAWVDAGRPCCGIVGTFPFMAPEMVLAPSYDALAADVWSLGAIFLTVLCNLSIFKKGVGVSVKKVPERDRAKREEKREAERVMTEKMKEFFATPGQLKALLKSHIRPELQVLLNNLETVQEGLLEVDAGQRWKADKLATASKMLEAEMQQE
jgi:hypothetical protein